MNKSIISVLFGAAILLTIGPAKAELVSLNRTLNPGATIDGSPVYAQNGGYSNGVAVAGSNGNRLFVEAGSQALCRVSGELLGVVPQSEWCYGGTSTSVVMQYNIDITLNDLGREFLLDNEQDSFSVFYSYFLSASHNSTGYEALTSSEEFRVGSQGRLRSGSSGNLKESGNTIASIKSVFNETISKSGTVEKVFGLNGGTLQFTFTAFSNSSALFGGGAKNVFGNNYSSAFVDPLVFVSDEFKNFVNIEEVEFGTTRIFEEFGQPLRSVNSPSSIALLTLGFSVLLIRRKAKAKI